MGQKKNTKMRTLFQRFNQKTLRAAERYRAARKALEVLDPGGDWQTRLQVLRPEDICGPGWERADKKERRPEMCEKRREESWIWLVSRGEMSQDIGVMEEHLDANLRVEWAKSQARAARWSEQVDLVAEEMRRTLAFLEWRAGWWRCQASRRVDISEQVHHGLVAYAERQADLLKRIAGGHVKHWLPILKVNSIVSDWAVKYLASGMSAAAGGEVGSDDSDDAKVDDSEEDIFDDSDLE